MISQKVSQVVVNTVYNPFQSKRNHQSTQYDIEMKS